MRAGDGGLVGGTVGVNGHVKGKVSPRQYLGFFLSKTFVLSPQAVLLP